MVNLVNDTFLHIEIKDDYHPLKLLHDNPYSLLELQKGASEEEIKKAYFATVKMYSPEIFPEEFKKVRKAYDMLRQPDSRAKIDILLLNKLKGPIGYRNLDEKTESIVKLQKSIKDLTDLKDKGGLAPDDKKKLLDLYRRRSIIYMNKNQYRDALDEWKRILELDRNDQETQRNITVGRDRLAWEYIRNGLYESAVNEWLAVKDQAVNKEEILHNLALCYTIMQNKEKENQYWIDVLDIWNERLNKDPDNELLKNYILEMHKYFGGRFLKIEKKSTVNNTPVPAPVKGERRSNVELAMACMEQKNWEQAIIAFNKCLDEKGDDIEVLNHLGWAHLNTGDKNTAFQMWNRALKIDPDSEITKKNIIQGHLTVAKNLKKQQLYAPALVHLKNLLKISKDNADILMEIGENYALQGDYHSARREWEKVLLINPRHKRAKQSIKAAKIKTR